MSAYKQECIRILSENVKAIRKMHKLSQKEFAKRLGVGVWSISKLENGILPPRLSTEFIFDMEDEFKIPAHKIVGPNPFD